jgi:hypothetical protein
VAEMTAGGRVPAGGNGGGKGAGGPDDWTKAGGAAPKAAAPGTFG